MKAMNGLKAAAHEDSPNLGNDPEVNKLFWHLAHGSAFVFDGENPVVVAQELMSILPGKQDVTTVIKAAQIICDNGGMVPSVAGQRSASSAKSDALYALAADRWSNQPPSIGQPTFPANLAGLTPTYPPPTAPSQSETSIPDADNTANAAADALDDIPSEDEGVLDAAELKALRAQVDEQVRGMKTPGIFSSPSQKKPPVYSILPDGVWQTKDGRCWREGREYPILVTLPELIAMWYAQGIDLTSLNFPPRRAA